MNADERLRAMTLRAETAETLLAEATARLTLALTAGAQAHDALAARVEQQARIFDTTLSSITDFAYIFDKAGRFAYVNQALLSLWGLALDDAVGKDFFDLKYPDELAARLQRQIQYVFASGEVLRDETPYTSPTGAGGYYEYIFVPVRATSGEIEVVAGSTRDITARKAAERDLEQLVEEQLRLQMENAALLEAERAARAEAERAGYVKDEFLAMLSHELRTPLNAIFGWAQVLTNAERDASDMRQGLAAILRNAHAQKKLIEDLLDMSRIVSGKVRLDIQSLQLEAVVAAAVNALQPTADARGVQVRSVVDSITPAIQGDENRLQQVVWNLLSNAIKFTPRGGQVEVIVAGAGSAVELTVTDTGIGIEPQFLPHAFERFRQSDASTTRAHGGLGLGLAIVRRLVDLHGGRVEARSEGRGKGATFMVSLPLAAGALVERELSGQVASDAPPAAAPIVCDPRLLEGVKVLIVDDDEDGRRLVGRILEDCAATVALAGSAQEALTLLHQFQPDVVLSDLGMPDIDGYELMRRVRSLGGKLGSVPAAALTALARPEDRTRALLSGYQSHIAKPVDAIELTAAVAALAGRMAAPIAAEPLSRTTGDDQPR